MRICVFLQTDLSAKYPLDPFGKWVFLFLIDCFVPRNDALNEQITVIANAVKQSRKTIFRRGLFMKRPARGNLRHTIGRFCEEAGVA